MSLSPDQEKTVALARFLHATLEDASRIHGLIPDTEARIPFDALTPEHAKTYLALATALRSAYKVELLKKKRRSV